MNNVVLATQLRQRWSRAGRRRNCRRRRHAGSGVFDERCRTGCRHGMRRVEAAHRLAILWSRVPCECKLERIEGIFARPAGQEFARISQRPCDFRGCSNYRISPNRVGHRLADHRLFGLRRGRLDLDVLGLNRSALARLRRNGLQLNGLRQGGLRLHGSGNFIATSRAHRAFVIGRGYSRHVGLTFLAPHPCGSIRNRKPTGEKATQPARQGIIVTVQIDARPVLPLVSRLPTR